MAYNYINGTGSSDNNTFNKFGTFRPSLNGTDLADRIFGYDGDDILLGNDGDDDLAGHIGNDRLEGGNGNDELNGGSGNDILLGGSGEDVLDGKNGNDILNGGAGPDHYEFSTALFATDVDRINGFSTADDDIKLLDTIFTSLPVGQVLPQNFTANATGTAVDANDFLVYNTTTGALSFDLNGNAAGGAHQFAVLTGIPTISAADFEVIHVLLL